MELLRNTYLARFDLWRRRTHNSEPLIELLFVCFSLGRCVSLRAFSNTELDDQRDDLSTKSQNLSHSQLLVQSVKLSFSFPLLKLLFLWITHIFVTDSDRERLTLTSRSEVTKFLLGTHHHPPPTHPPISPCRQHS